MAIPLALPLAIIAGFLGSGKTTFLTAYARRIAQRRRVVFLVNEFAQTDVDTPLLAGAEACAVGIAGGSIFCRCKVTEFLRQLGDIPARFPGVDGVVVEASGMADPSAGRSLLAESGLDRSYAFQGTLALADPATLPKILDTLPATSGQIAAADTVVISKCDLHDEATIRAAEELVRAINPEVRIVRVVRGDCALDPLALGSERWVDGAVVPCADPLLVPVEVTCPAAVDPAAVAEALAAFGHRLHRAKGYLPTRDGWRFLDWSAGRMQLDTCTAGPPGLALIVHPDSAGSARALAERIRDGAFAA